MPGSNLNRRRTRRQELKRLRRRAFRRSPCDRPPVTPTNLADDFDTRHRRRHDRLRAKLRWGEVVLDTSGFPIRIRGYDVEWNFADDANAAAASPQAAAGSSGWNQDPERFFISAKDDLDPGTKAHLVIKSLNIRLYYRWRVRTKRDKECASAWTAWQVMGFPTDDEPPASPQNVKIMRAAQGIRLKWKAPDDPSDAELITDDIDHFIAELHSSSDFTALVERKRMIRNESVVFQLEDDQCDGVDDTAYFGRVRAAAETGIRSPWIPATKAGNSSPTTPPDGRKPRHVPTISNATPAAGDVPIWDDANCQYAPGVPATGGLDIDATIAWAYIEMWSPPSGSGDAGFAGLVNGTGASLLTLPAVEVEHPGVRTISTGTTTTGEAGVVMGTTTSTPGGNFELDSGPTIYQAILKTSATLSDGTNRYAICVGYTRSQLDPLGATRMLIVAYRDDVNGGKWFIRATNAVGTTDVDLGVTVATSTWYNIKIIGNAAGTSFEVFINGVSAGTISSNIPSAEALYAVSVIRKSLGITARTMDLDLSAFKQTGLTR